MIPAQQSQLCHDGFALQCKIVLHPQHGDSDDEYAINLSIRPMNEFRWCHYRPSWYYMYLVQPPAELTYDFYFDFLNEQGEPTKAESYIGSLSPVFDLESKTIGQICETLVAGVAEEMLAIHIGCR